MRQRQFIFRYDWDQREKSSWSATCERLNLRASGETLEEVRTWARRLLSHKMGYGIIHRQLNANFEEFFCEVP
jgi:hypothetical protein